jgi:hypothetical protein
MKNNGGDPVLPHPKSARFLAGGAGQEHFNRGSYHRLKTT